MMIARFSLPFRALSSSPKNAIFSFRLASTKSDASAIPSPSTASQSYKAPPPRRLYLDGYLRDYRKDRPLLSMIDYKSPNGNQRKIRIEQADEKDIELIGQLFADHFLKECSMFYSLDPTYDEIAQFCFDDVTAKLPSKMSMLVKDGEKCIGFHILDKIEKRHFGKYFTNGTFMENPVLDIKDDYAEDIKYGPYKCRKPNLIVAALDVPFSQTLRFLPKDVQTLLHFEAVGIDKKYQNAGIFPELVRLMTKIGKEHGCDHGIVYSVAKESASISLKVWKHLFTFPYDKFKENGKVIFNNLPDGAKGIVVAYSKL